MFPSAFLFKQKTRAEESTSDDETRLAEFNRGQLDRSDSVQSIDCFAWLMLSGGLAMVICGGLIVAASIALTQSPSVDLIRGDFDSRTDPRVAFYDDRDSSSSILAKYSVGAPVASTYDEEVAMLAATQFAAAMKVAQDSRDTERLIWLRIAPNHVVADEGEAVEDHEKMTGSIAECETMCKSTIGCKSFTMCVGECSFKKKALTGSEPTVYNAHCSSYYQTADTYRPVNRELALPSNAPTHTFYVYRAQGPSGVNGSEKYSVSNVNVGSIGGVMLYLHDEVIGDCPRSGLRKFGINRIRRFKITTKATQPLFKKNMNFGLKCSFDSGECTRPHRDHVEGQGTGWHAQQDFSKYGFYVGCNNLGEWPYPNAIWYSLPGPCPFMNYRSATNECRFNFPGGRCDQPDGRGNCTYSIEDAGEIDIDELVGIKDKFGSRAAFCSSGGYEGSSQANGHKLDFWNSVGDAKKAAWRAQQALDMFHKKYPDMPKEEDMKPPRCDVIASRFYAP